MGGDWVILRRKRGFFIISSPKRGSHLACGVAQLRVESEAVAPSPPYAAPRRQGVNSSTTTAAAAAVPEMGWPPEGSAAVCEVNLGDTFAGGEGFGFYPPAMMAAEPPRAAETTIRSWPTSEESSTMKRKQSHNAYERDRRKKMNGLYSSLRSLLPESEHNVGSFRLRSDYSRFLITTG